ncbi:TIGR03986 family type III CRISPR-associated RAMP protein [Rhodovulum sulfidophilum]|uniref:TIGR03986 family type III CRISPR-associated RAMP protein n=1 Tax=Rhodovulum sulfidophilum TaxID=35806 RepID=UPI0009520D95|nr:TIGR03986 family CRISPR-associated RAMP protein [Rhodovulum sulfidophilum]MBL3553146.1 TIGR03986 family CRISPR-associated RAMP protein [Rhodovulum sulfidophilum]OLS50200.1 CRISPR-associated RAMP family protein [Rhodovulum sulfidophilum]
MTLSAPYSFVPLSQKVFLPDEAKLGVPSQDAPVEGGVSGTIAFTLTSDTPLLVGGANDKKGEKTFMKAPGDCPVIPGSSLRGMIRNVMEIATFGKMQLVDDQRVTVRDLQHGAKEDYRDRMSGTIDGAYAPRSFAGFLKFVDGRPTLFSCEFGRIDHRDLEDLIDRSRLPKVEVDDAGTMRRKTLHEVFETISDGDSPAENGIAITQTEARFVEGRFLELGGKLEHKDLWVQTGRAHHLHRDDKKLAYRRVAASMESATRETNMPAQKIPGRLVFTGMPSDKKHMEFFFFGRRDDLACEISETVWRKFLNAHEEQEKESITWKWRKLALNRGEAIPVFWLGIRDERSISVEHLGLAMMFKLPADNSIHDMIGRESPHLDEPRPDLATRLFGRIADTTKETGMAATQPGFKTRLSFSWAILTTPREQYSELEKRTPRARPKPGYVPSYVRQRDLQANGQLRQIGMRKKKPIYAPYRSYMNKKDGQADRIRGWKRYPARPVPEGAPVPDVPEGAEGNAVILRPIQARQGELTFKGKIRFHNLHPAELGALLWVLTWGGNSELVHSLGSGRDFGWGQVRFRIGGISYAYGPPSTDPVMEFRQMMDEWAGRAWEDLREVRQLKAMASPAIGAEQMAELQQMKLTVGEKDESPFVRAKRSGQALPEYPMWRDGKPEPAPFRSPVTNPSNTSTRKAFYFGEPVQILRQEGDKAWIRYEGDEDGEPERVLLKHLTFR